MEVSTALTQAGINRVSIQAVDVDGRQSHVMHFTISRGGIWQFYDDNERDVAEGIAKHSDRAAAVIAGSIIEVRMQDAISSIFQRRPKKVEERLFMPSGPLGSFAVKIDLAYLLGLLSADGYHDMVIMKDIRNAFAHRLDIRDFKTPTIRDRCFNLRMIETHVGDTKFQAGESILSFAPDDRPRLRV